MTVKTARAMMTLAAGRRNKKNRKPMDKKKKMIIIIASVVGALVLGLVIAFAGGSVRRRRDRCAGFQEHDVRRSTAGCRYI